MKKTLKLLSVLCALLLLAGCNSKRATLQETEKPFSTDQTEEQEYTLYLPDDAPYLFSGEIEAGKTMFLDEIIKTNTTGIKIKNNSDMAITCELYYPDNRSDSILIHTIEPGKTGEFTGLTSRYTYCLSFRTDEAGTVEVKITG